MCAVGQGQEIRGKGGGLSDGITLQRWPTPLYSSVAWPAVVVGSHRPDHSRQLSVGGCGGGVNEWTGGLGRRPIEGG